MSQQLPRFYLPALLIGMIGTLFRIPFIREFLILILLLGLCLLAFLALKFTWKWLLAPSTDPIQVRFYPLITFYGSSMSVLLFLGFALL